MGKDKLDSYSALKTLEVGSKTYRYFSLPEAARHGLGNIDGLPVSLKVLLENLLRHEDGSVVQKSDIAAVSQWLKKQTSTHEIAYHPARVLMQDFTGVPAVVDLAAMRQAMTELGGDPQKINPLSPVDLVIDHSVTVDHFGTPDAFKQNVDLEFERNNERYEFLKWAQNSFDNFRVVPPGTGICHQVNLEYLAKVVWTKEENGETFAYPDTLVGTDSHTTMINGLSVLGWGVGGIEAEAAMLSQPISMLIPEVVGCKLSGNLREGVTATDLVLTVVEKLRQKGVVGKFVEFFGNGLESLDLANRATIANMAPEYGATCGFFPIDDETIRYLRFSGRDEDQVELVEKYAKAQGLWNNPAIEPVYTDVVEISLDDIEACISGPKRPQDRILLKDAASSFQTLLEDVYSFDQDEISKEAEVASEDYSLQHGHVALAAITSCTNTSNPSVLIGAGLVAKKALEKGLKVKPWVKTSLAPGSQVVTDYLEKAGLQDSLDQLGFNLVGYGCTTCIGNSGGLEDHVSKVVNDENLVVCSVLSGNRNFEGRIGQDLRANYLASPPLVVAYAIAGSMHVNLDTDSLGQDHDGNDVYLSDIWPSNAEIQEALEHSLSAEMFKERYANVFKGPVQWQNTPAGEGFTFNWSNDSTYVRHPSFFESMDSEASGQEDIIAARPLAILGDSVTTDHISPAGAIKADSPAGSYLRDHGVGVRDFNSYGSRRGNHEVMMRGTFANVRIRNEMVPGVEGGFTKHIPSNEQMSIYDASMKYQSENTPLVVVGGKEYGTGSSRDWAAKGTNLLGVRAVITESFERIHRSNLIGMGVLPLQFTDGESRETLGLNGTETFDITGISELEPRQELDCTVTYEDGSSKQLSLLCRLDTEDELSYYNNGGILQYVLRKLK